jgi:hypothetical protein
MNISFVNIIFCFIAAISPVQSNGEPVSMDMEWIIQGGDFAPTGFVLEMLGIGSALRTMLPRCRVVKSYFRNSLDESAIGPKFMDTLLPEEQETVMSLTGMAHQLNMKNPLKFQNISRQIEDSLCSELVLEDIDIHLQMTRPLVNVSNSSACCNTCVSDPLCIGWSYGCGQHETCILHGRTKQKHDPTSISDRINDGLSCIRGAILPGSYRRLPAPRALVFHGTSCDYNNQTISKLARDINTIWIGRFMLERGGDSFFAGGLGREEMEVLKCASVMDEVWVPTAWNRDSMMAIAKQINLRLPNVVVIPEAVDTVLFDPTRVADICENSPVDTTSYPSSFQFLSVFKWEHRKGWDILLAAYWSAFSVHDDVVLRLHTYRPSFLSGQKNITENLAEYAMQQYGKNLDELARVSIGDDAFEGTNFL